MLHVANDPWLGGDYCLDHARQIVASTALIVTCECPICARARRVVPDRPPRLLSGPGCWQVTTETSAYLLELEDSGTGSLVRQVGTGEGHSPEAVELPPPLAVGLRRDGESIAVLWAEEPVVGKPWTVLLDVRRDGTPTRRTTTLVRSILSEPVP